MTHRRIVGSPCPSLFNLLRRYWAPISSKVCYMDDKHSTPDLRHCAIPRCGCSLPDVTARLAEKTGQPQLCPSCLSLANAASKLKSRPNTQPQLVSTIN